MKTTNKIIINSEVLLSALQIAAKMFSKSIAVPIIEYYLFSVSNGNLTVSVTDLVNTLKVSFGIEGKDAIFNACVPPTIVKYLQKLTSSNGPAPITMIYNEETFGVEITDDKGRAKYSGENSIDFPRGPQESADYFETTSDVFKEFKDLVNYAATDELRPAMNGIAFYTHEGKLNLAASNGHVLKVVNVDSEFFLHPGIAIEAEKQHFILSAKCAKILSDFKFTMKTGKKIVNNTVGVVITKAESIETGKYHNKGVRSFTFSFPYSVYNINLQTRDIDERFPEYWNVIPEEKSAETKYLGFKENFLGVLDMAELFANKTTHQIRLGLNGVNKLSAEDLDFNNEYCAEIDGKYEGTPIEIGFNAKFLRQIVSSFGDSFTLEMRKPNNAGVIRDGKSIALAMPVMLNQYV